MKFLKAYSDCPHFINFYEFSFFVKNGVAKVRYGSVYLDKRDLIFACNCFYARLSSLNFGPIIAPFNLNACGIKCHDLVVYLHGLLVDLEKLLKNNSSSDYVFVTDDFVLSSLKSYRLPHGVLRKVQAITLELVSVTDKNGKLLGYVHVHDGKIICSYESIFLAKISLGHKYPSQLYYINFLIH